MSRPRRRQYESRLLATGVLAFGCLAGTVPAMSTALAAAPDDDVEWAGLFHDQGPLYASTTEPTCSTPVELTFRTFQQDVTGVDLSYWDTADSTRHVVPMEAAGTDPTGRFDLWNGTIPASCSVKYYRFGVTDGADTDWYNAGGTQDNEPQQLDFPVVPGFDTPEWAKQAVMYQIFPDRFANGDSANDVQTGEYSYFDAPTQAKQWGEDVTPDPPAGASSVFFGGDLQGISQNMDYLKQTLGVDAFYLNPIFTSPTNHKYDTQDYENVDPHLGGNAAFETLVDDIHSSSNGPAGKLILDGVFNHSGSWTKWFDRGDAWPDVTGAHESQDSEFYDWYTFYQWPNEYASFFDATPSMPKFDFADSGSAVRQALYGSTDSVAQRWIRQTGIDGWRLDAAQYADANGGNGSNATNHEIWSEFRTAVKDANPDALIFGEQWGKANSWTTGGQWDGATNFNGFTTPVSRWITGKDVANQAAPMSTTEFDNWLRGTRADYPAQAQQVMSNHLSNHDIHRFTTRAGGGVAKTDLAHIFQLTYVGMPTIYYGDEYGMLGGADPQNRRTFDMSKATTENPSVALVKRLIEIRRTYPALRTGSFLTLGADDQSNVYAYGRMDAENRIAVVLNNSGTEREYTVPAYQLSIPDGETMTDELSGTSYTVADGTVTVSVEPYGGAVLVN